MLITLHAGYRQQERVYGWIGQREPLSSLGGEVSGLVGSAETLSAAS